MHTLQPLNADKNIIYYQTYGGGGLGVGLLGPFGVMANIKMIEANTMKDVAQMTGKLAVMPANIFAASAETRHWHISPEGPTQGTRFCPYLLVEKTEGDVLLFAAAVLIDTGDKLPSKYLVELPLRKSVTDIAALDEAGVAELGAALQGGYDLLLDRIELEEHATPAAEQQVLIRSEFLTPRFGFELPGTIVAQSEAIVWLRISGSVAGVRVADVNLKPTGKK